MSETVTVVVPAVGFKGPDDTDASTFRRAAWNLEHDYPAGGSNTRMAISILLRRVADELDAYEYGRLRSTILDVADQLDRLSRAGGQYAEIRRHHAALLRAAVEKSMNE